MSIARKKKVDNFSAGTFKDYKHSIKASFNTDLGFYFLNQIRGTSAYCKKIQCEVLAMIKQLRCSTFFLTVSCDGLKWGDVPQIILKINNLNLPIEKISC